jgi:hypothetical protein
VKLEFGATAYEWSETVADHKHEQIRFVNQGKGFLDYKALLEVHYVPSDDGRETDLFPMLIGRLLPSCAFPHAGRNREFRESWGCLNGDVGRRWTRMTVLTLAIRAENGAVAPALQRTTRGESA